MSSIHLRAALEKDIPAFVQINVEAFHDSAFHAAAFPPHLRVKPGLEDQVGWGIYRAHRDISKPSNHYIVAVDQIAGGEEAVVGFAEWVSPSVAVEVPDEKTAEEKAKIHAERMASIPAFFDRSAMAAGDAEIKELLDSVKPSLEGKKMDSMWTLNSIAVDDKYRGRGIGKMLTRWGMEAAEKNGEDIWLIASPHGLSMYQSLGFKQIGEGARLGERQVFMTKFLDEK